MKYFDFFVNLFYFVQVRSNGAAIKMENLQPKKNEKTRLPIMWNGDSGA